MSKSRLRKHAKFVSDEQGMLGSSKFYKERRARRCDSSAGLLGGTRSGPRVSLVKQKLHGVKGILESPLSGPYIVGAWPLEAQKPRISASGFSRARTVKSRFERGRGHWRIFRVCVLLVHLLASWSLSGQLSPSFQLLLFPLRSACGKSQVS